MQKSSISISPTRCATNCASTTEVDQPRLWHRSCDRAKVTAGIRGMYAAAKLKEPRIVS